MMTTIYMRIIRSVVALLWTIQTQIIAVDSFSPGDVSSIAAAVAAAHIGKPPPSNIPTMLHKDESNRAPGKSYIYSKHSHRINVIGKAPENSKHSIDDTMKSASDRSHRYSTTSIQVNEETTYNETSHRSCFGDVPLPDMTVCDVDDAFRRKRNSSTEEFHFGNNYNCYDNNDIETDTEEEMPAIQATFCGYRATFEELSRLRSANIA